VAADAFTERAIPHFGEVKVLQSDASGADEEKSAFLGLAGQIMKRLLIDHSRPLYRCA
jgi:hypothetical protein